MKCKTCNTNKGRCVDVLGKMPPPLKNNITFEWFICDNCLPEKLNELKESGFIIDQINDSANKKKGKRGD